MAELEFRSQTVKPKGHEHNKCKDVGVSIKSVSWEASFFLPSPFSLALPHHPSFLFLLLSSSPLFFSFVFFFLFGCLPFFVCFYFFLFSTGQLEALLPLKNCYHHLCKICGCPVVTQSLVCSILQFLTVLLQGKFLVS